MNERGLVDATGIIFPTPPEPVRDGEGAPIVGPMNLAREAEGPSGLAPPETDHGTLPNLNWTFADWHNRLQPGGWSRQTTGRELPIAQALNCVNMRLKAGAVRELHWHKPDEWGFVIRGRVRITAVDQTGRAFVDDVGEGDVWNFPGGIPHSIQGLDGEGAEFLLVFNDGNFNEDETFLVRGSRPKRHRWWEVNVRRRVNRKSFVNPTRIGERHENIAGAHIPRSIG